ncbi:MAG TPA: efflux RND transporter periplasmic adaptor subunit [Luteibacter sp.]|nr:efflux RND transporter periplasmic adaptor subunit [Luteibacter sp.]
MTPATPKAGRRAGRHGWIAILVVVLCAIAWYASTHRSAAHPAAPAVGVSTAVVARRDMPTWVAGVGTVTPINVVTVKSRVDGQLDKVAFEEGQMVAAGDLLARIDPRPFQASLAQAEGAARRDAAQHANAELDLARYAKLSQLQVVPRQQLDAQKAQAEALLATVAADRGAVDAARLDLSFTRVTAPIAGRVGQRIVDEGTQVHASDATGLVTITQIEPITVAFSVSQDVLAPLAEAQRNGPLAVTVSARDGSKQLATGTLVFVDSQVAAGTGQVLVKARFDNHDHALWPGAFVAAKLLLSTQHDALAIPAAAVQRDQTGTFVYIVDGGRTARVRRVETGGDADGFTLIAKGLSAGEHVVIEGQGNLQPDVPVDEHLSGAVASTQ